MFENGYVSREIEENFCLDRPGYRAASRAEGRRLRGNIIFLAGPDERDVNGLRESLECLHSQDYDGSCRIIGIFNGVSEHVYEAVKDLVSEDSIYQPQAAGYVGAVNLGLAKAEELGGEFNLIVDGDTRLRDKHALRKAADAISDGYVGGYFKLKPSPEYGNVWGIKKYYDWTNNMGEFLTGLSENPLLRSFVPATATGIICMSNGYGFRMPEIKRKQDVALMKEMRRYGKIKTIDSYAETSGRRYAGNPMAAWMEKVTSQLKVTFNKTQDLPELKPVYSYG